MSKDGVYISADLGVNWRGDLHELGRMVEDCLCAKVDAVKLQWFDQEHLDTGPYEPGLRRLLGTMCLNRRFIKEFAKNIHKAGLEVVVTPFSMRQLAEMPEEVDGIKIRAADCFKADMVRKAQSLGKPVYVSVPVVNGYFIKPEDVPEGAFLELMGCMMQPNTYMVMCVPKYPPKAEELFLHRASDFQGFSSHYPHHSAPFIAATIAVHSQMWKAKRRFYLEVHYTPTDDSKDREVVPDMDVSLCRDQLEQLVCCVETLERGI